MNKKKQKKNENELTPRQKEVLNLIKLLMDDYKIGEKLTISHHTAHSHRKDIYKKLDVHSDAEAIVKGIQLGYIEIKPKE